MHRLKMRPQSSSNIRYKSLILRCFTRPCLQRIPQQWTRFYPGDHLNQILAPDVYKHYLPQLDASIARQSCRSAANPLPIPSGGGSHIAYTGREGRSIKHDVRNSRSSSPHGVRKQRIGVPWVCIPASIIGTICRSQPQPHPIL